MRLDRVDALTNSIFDAFLSRGKFLGQGEHLGNVRLRDDEHAVGIAHNEIARVHCDTSQLHWEAMANEGTAMANRLLNHTPAVGGGTPVPASHPHHASHHQSSCRRSHG